MFVVKFVVMLEIDSALAAVSIAVSISLDVELVADIELAIVIFVLKALDTVTISLLEPSRTIPVFKLAELDTIH